MAGPGGAVAQGGPQRAAPASAARDLALVVVLGLLAGALLALLTGALSRSTIGGPGWSLSGNGALIVPFVAGPALLAAGWTMLALRRLGNRAWLTAGLLAGLGALLLALVANIAPIMGFGTQNILMAAGVILGLLVGGLLAGTYESASPRVRRVSMLAGGLLLALEVLAAIFGFFYLIFPLLLPLAVATPLLATALSHERGSTISTAWLLAGIVLLPIALVAGFWLSNLLAL